ncbi:hypothetical protein [Actinoplanes sp. RD1]|uniref:hypothetical protein n=1 Tax=Actinoplanes sp. RD1 TaxID=3064538 RepID=UPI0027419921|nr:hypothetical protein [Actinoplanes sp. RD1]
MLRYKLGGQWPLILSGGLSVFVGSRFIMQAADSPLNRPAGYALAGGVFFLVSAVRLTLRRRKAAEAAAGR